MFKKESIEQMAARRLEKCYAAKIVNGRKIPCEFNYVGMCIKCVCGIKAAVRTPNKSCPQKKW